MSGTMKAIIWEGHPYHMSLRDIPRPRLQEPGDVIVRLTTSAICGTDLHTYHGLLGGPKVPYTMGHEGVGIVVEVAEGVQNTKLGDRVVVPDIFYNPTTPPEVESYGLGQIYGTYVGGCQAEYVRIPDADTQARPIPFGTEHEDDFIMLSDIFPTAWGSLTNTGFQAGDTVAVFGAGPVGLLAAYSALLRGANKVYSIDHVIERLDKARSIGAIPIYLQNGRPAEQILKREPGGVNRTIDAVGYECVNSKLEPQENFVIEQAVRVTAPNGGIFLTGVYWAAKPSPGEPRIHERDGTIKFPVGEWYIKNISINGGGVFGTNLWQPLKELIVNGRAKPSFVVDKVVSIDEVVEAYKGFSEHKYGKVLIKF